MDNTQTYFLILNESFLYFSVSESGVYLIIYDNLELYLSVFLF